ncbi:MAG: septum formation initiator family protein [Candidatus Nomurabacteria bacterium]|nr:MAG: septum formation initiator family protein [Candidatus Nomurabacteria bacterium]
MFDFHQKRKFRTVLNSRVTQVFIFLAAILILWSAYDRYLIAKEMSEKRLAVEKELSDLKDRKDNLEKEVEYLSSERGIEAEMRRQFDVAREGEQVVIIMDDDTATTVRPLSSTSTDQDNNRPWYKFW